MQGRPGIYVGRGFGYGSLLTTDARCSSQSVARSRATVADLEKALDNQAGDIFDPAQYDRPQWEFLRNLNARHRQFYGAQQAEELRKLGIQ
jgi:hypothetical protein